MAVSHTCSHSKNDPFSGFGHRSLPPPTRRAALDAPPDSPPHAAFTGARALVITINRTPHRRSNRSRADHLRPTSAAPPLGADAVPFFDDSYAVDSANVGPYGAAIMTELLPAVEAKYRGIG